MSENWHTLFFTLSLFNFLKFLDEPSKLKRIWWKQKRLFFNFVEKERKNNRNEPPCQYVVLPALSRCEATVFPYKQVCRPNTSLTSLSLTETLHTDMGKTSALSSLENHYAEQNSTEWCFLVSKANEVFPSFWLNPERIDGVAVGFYLWACSQGKACRHTSRDEVSIRMKGLFWFLSFSTKVTKNHLCC